MMWIFFCVTCDAGEVYRILYFG